MSEEPLVSVIVTTRNNHATLHACLASITKQSYIRIELLVVDNHSTDDTLDIARKYTKHVYTKGPERSTQRNFAVTQAKGEYVCIIDSDMELSEQVISSCVDVVRANKKNAAVIIPEESFGIGFWAQCKRLERSFYIGNDTLEAARFFKRTLYQKLGGYDEAMVSGEDWDLSQRAAAETTIARIDALIYHNEGKLKLLKSLQKKYYYAGLSRAYLKKQHVTSKLTNSAGPLQRYELFFSRPGKLFRNPLLGVGMLFMKTCEFGFGGIGYVVAGYKDPASPISVKRILILSHANANSGAIDRYEDFLQRKGYTLLKLTHPLDSYENGRSVMYDEGKEKQSFRRRNLGTANLLIDFKINLQMLRKINADAVVGANNFDTYSAILARRLFRKKTIKIIYFASDFSEQRFSSKLLDAIYMRVERMALRGSDLVVSNTRRAESKRIKLGLKPEKSLVVVNSAYRTNPIFAKKEISKKEFIYVGSLTQEHGLYDFLDKCGSIIGELTIIGDGPDRERILELCKGRHIKAVYLGQKSHQWTTAYMQEFGGIGLAPYSRGIAGWVHYASSLKIYEYLAYGLPVIASDVTEQADLVAEYNLGIIYDRLSPTKIASRLKLFNTQNFHNNAKKFYELFNQEKEYQKIIL